MANEKTFIWSMIFYSFAGYLTGREYAMPLLAIGAMIAISVSEWHDFLSFCSYIASVLLISLFIVSTNFDFTSAMISSVLGGVFFFFVPYKTIKKINTASKYATKKEIVNRDRGKASQRIEELANCFWHISNCYKKLANGTITNSNATEYIYSETNKHICLNCSNYKFCQQNQTLHQAETEYLASVAISKGKTTILDFGEYISKNCINKVEYINFINSASSKVNIYKSTIEEKNKGKEEIARAYFGVSKVLNKLSFDTSKKLSFDEKAEETIAKSLEKSSIFYRELFIYQNENKCICVEMLANQCDSEKIIDCIEEILTAKFEVAHIAKDENMDCEYMIFVKSPRIKIEYGYATKPKITNAPNGDSMTIMNLPNGRFVCAICDGMGSGKSASDFSSKTISFIENLFKAGFVASDIITSVNSFMECGEYNSYATLDILEIDLYEERAYLYKIGSPDTYYHSNKTYMISSKALPIGIMKDIKLEINSIDIHPQDRFILSSDGILDYMRKEINHEIASKYNYSPQSFANEIMQSCDRKMKIKKADDRTVIAVFIDKND